MGQKILMNSLDGDYCTSEIRLRHPSTDKIQLIMRATGETKERTDLSFKWEHFFNCFNWRKDE